MGGWGRAGLGGDGREHLFFALETEIHCGRLAAFRLPALPPPVRERLTGDRELTLESVSLLPDLVVAKARRS
jgi:hypothetical protein